MAAPTQSQRTERLLNLLFVLLAAARPVDKATLRTSLPAYRDSPSEDAFERMFERDKEELRSLGVPIETVEGSGSGGVDGYQVRQDRYALPEVGFTVEELAVLGLAARVWDQAALAPAARSALLKLEASGPQMARTDDDDALITRVGTVEPAFPEVLAACQRRRVVSFDYRKPGEATSTRRTVQPWGVVNRRGHWYVAGHDVQRGATRVFRLSRMEGTVSVSGPESAYEVPADIDVRAVMSAFVPPADQLATVEVRVGAALALRRTAISTAHHTRTDWDVIEVTYGDDEVFARELAGYGARVVAIAPASLRDAVIAHLQRASA